MAYPGLQGPFSALVIDDDEFVRGLVAQQLLSLGAGEVCTAGNGRDARERLVRTPSPQLIVCDLMMPDADGIELMRDVASACRDAAVVLISSAAPKVLRSAQELARRRGLRVLGQLSKPVRRSALQALLDQLPRAPEAEAEAEDGALALAADAIDPALAAGQFIVAVQPQLDLRSRRLAGAEALVRWQHPQLGLLAPDAFLPLVEQAGLIEALADSVLQQALQACADWRAHGLELSVAVNFDASTLRRPGLPDCIEARLQRVGLPAEALVIELTEHGLARDRENVLEVLTRLRLRQVELAIDDFGTGFSSLERLREIPFTELKLDRQFVPAAADDAEARHIVESNLRLARDLGLRTVAEGVASAADLELMTRLGCDRAQAVLKQAQVHRFSAIAAGFGADSGTGRRRQGAADPAAEAGLQLAQQHRLGQVVVHARRHAALPLALQAARAQGDDRQPTAGGAAGFALPLRRRASP